MKKFHINSKDEIAECHATKRACRYGEHFPTKQEAMNFIENSHNLFEGATHTKQKPEEETKKIKYSFLEDFKEIEQSFDEEFEGIPPRFFTQDFDEIRRTPEDPENDEYIIQPMYTDKALQKITTMMSSVTEDKMPDDDVIEHMEKLGLTNVRKLEKNHGAGSAFGDRAFAGDSPDGKKIVVCSGKTKQPFCTYQMRTRVNTDFTNKNGRFSLMTVRSITGLRRMERISGIPGVDMIPGVEKEDRNKQNKSFNEAVIKLKEKQQEGQNFRLQKKHIRESVTSVATAWQDKKHPDVVHQELANNTSLKKKFRHIEIDNDVDPKEFKNFEESYEEIQNKLPKIRGDRVPELRIRKLGKHNATGVFFAHSNTIAIDVRNSSSFVHEYAHYIDLIARDNQSLKNDFKEISSEYQKRLKVTDGKNDYYKTPTEIHSRAFEMYAHEKLGINNRLLDPEKFEREPFGPFKESPGLKKKVFELFDKLYGKEN